MIKKALLVAALLLVTLWFTGCQTVAGLGGDIKWTADTAAELLEGE